MLCYESEYVMDWGPTMLSFNEHENPHFDYEYNTHFELLWTHEESVSIC